MAGRTRDLVSALAVGATILVAGLAVHRAEDAGIFPSSMAPIVHEFFGHGHGVADLSAALNAQADLTTQFIDRAGVVGTAVGRDALGHAVVKVYLESPGTSFLPRSFAGVQVVTEVIGPVYALGHAPWDQDALATEGTNPRSRFSRPVPIGASSGQADVTAGTIGARATDGSRIFALSNNHVFANSNAANRGDAILQPGVADGGSNGDSFGTLHDYEEIHFCRGALCSDNRIDAAIALTSSDDLATATPTNGYGTPRSGSVEADLGQKVQKYGRTTGHTKGKVTGVNAVINVNYRTGVARFVDQIMISGSGATFSAGGDSGSLIVTDGWGFADRRPVGLLFAGSATNTIANPIDLVLDRFDIQIDDSGN